MFFGPGCVLGVDAGLNRLDFRGIGLGEERGQLVFVGPLPILNLGLLGERLELRRFQLADLILKELFLEGDFLAVGSEQLLGQIGAAGNRLFRLGNRVEEILVAGRRVGNDDGLGGVFEGRFLFQDQLLFGLVDCLFLDRLGHVGTGFFL